MIFVYFAEKGGLIHVSDLERQQNAKLELRALIITHGCMGIHETNGHDLLSSFRWILELLSKRDMLMKIADPDWRINAQLLFNKAVLRGKDVAKDAIVRMIEDIMDKVAA